jgi:cell division protein ZapA
MAEVDIHIASRAYPVACRDGEEARLRDVAALVDAKARAATAALGHMSEARTLLFASLMLADGLVDGPPAPPPAPPAPEIDPLVAEALERLATRMEALAASLEEAVADA